MTQSPGGCQCSAGCSATITGNVKGCNSLNAPGVTVEAHDSTSGGTLLGTATTDSSGNYSISATGATAGNAIVVVWSHTRLTTATTTLTHTTGSTSSTTWKCGGTSSSVNKTLSPATDYHCIAGCALPIWKDLPYTDANGAGTLNWDGAKWIASSSKSQANVATSVGASPGCAVTTATVALNYDIVLTPAGLLYNQVKFVCQTVICYATNGVTIPGGCSGFSSGTSTSSLLSATIACPESFSATSTSSANMTTSLPGTPNPGAGLITVTE
jgi:hypothetical protein